MRATSVLLLLVSGVAGCAANPAPTVVPTPAPVLREAPAPAATVPPGRAQIIVNGDDGPTGPVSCDTADGLTTISIGATSLGVTVIVTDDDVPVVRSVSIGDVGGVALGFAAADGRVAPSARRNGATVVVTGTGSGTDSADPARIVESGYRIAVACP